jgi:hypothetical protein
MNTIWKQFFYINNQMTSPEKILLNIQLRIYLQKRYLKSILVCFLGKRRCTMEIPEALENKLNAAFVAGLTVFIVVFWFLVIPSA